jgi:hypothetical protein
MRIGAGIGRTLTRVRESRAARRLAVFTAAAALSIAATVTVAPAPAVAADGSWDLVAFYDDYYQCLAEGPQWLGGPVIDFTCTYAGGGSTELWVLHA